MAENEAPTMTAPVQARPMTDPSMPSAMPWAMPPESAAPTSALPVTGVPANAAPRVGAPQEELLESGQKAGPRGDLMARLRTPMIAAVVGGVLVFGVGFGSGFVVGRDNSGTSASTGVQDGTGVTPDGGTGFGQRQGQGQGRQGFGGPMDQQQGTDQQGTDTTTDSTGLAGSQ